MTTGISLHDPFAVTTADQAKLYHRQDHAALALLLDAVNARPLYAKGDGLTDDWEAIQTALDANAAGVVYLPKATYRFDTGLVVTGALAAAPGTILDYYGDGPALTLTGTDTFLDGFTVTGLHAHSGAEGIRITAATHCRLENILITSFSSGAGLHLRDSVICLDLIRCQSDGNAYGLLSSFGDDTAVQNLVTMQGGTLHSSRGPSVAMIADERITVPLCDSWSFQRVLVEANAGGMLLDRLRTVCLIDSCWFEGNGGSIRLDSPGANYAVLPYLISITGSVFSAFTPYIDARKGQQVVVDRNGFYNSLQGSNVAISYQAGVGLALGVNAVHPLLSALAQLASGRGAHGT